jgi:hypothetical protein
MGSSGAACTAAVSAKRRERMRMGEIVEEGTLSDERLALPTEETGLCRGISGVFARIVAFSTVRLHL